MTNLFFFQVGSIRTALRMSMTVAFCAIRELMFHLRMHQAGECWIVKYVLQVIRSSFKEEMFSPLAVINCGKVGGADIQIQARR